MIFSFQDVLMGASAAKAGSAPAGTSKRGPALEKAGGARYDLLLKGGEFIDPASGRRGRYDVAFTGDKVAAIEADIDASLAKQVESSSGAMVVPGLIDMHVHGVEGLGTGANPDVLGVNRGVTTIVDGGTCGTRTFGVVRRVVAPSKTRVLAMLNLSTIGITDSRGGEFILANLIIPEEAVAVARKNPDVILGFKGRLSNYVTGGAPSLPILKRLVEAGKEANLPVMIHVGDTFEPLGEILNLLRPGDICSHYLTSRRNGILGSQAHPGAKLIPQIFEARKRGVILDISRGSTMHMGFPQLEATIEAGLLPDTISTDLTANTVNDPQQSVLMIGTALMSWGVSFEECLKMMTVNSAKAMRRPELGKLEGGGVGDATLLKIENGDFTVKDVDGRSRKANKRLVAAGVVRAGSYMKVSPPPIV